MQTSINKSSRGSLLRRPVRDRGYSRRRRDHELRTRSIAHDPAGEIGQKPKSASSRVAFVSGAKAIVPVLLALVPFGMAFGASAAGSGLSTLESLAMSVLIAAGAAQLAAVQLIASGASVAIVVLTVLVINLRLTLYSASLAPHFRRLPVGWKGLLSYHLTDQAYVATITRFDGGEIKERDKRWYYLGVGMTIWSTWQVASMLGVLVGSWASEGWSLDFVMPLISSPSPSLPSRTARRRRRPSRRAWRPCSPRPCP